MGRVLEHNREIMYSAQSRAAEMEVFPSKLEERMKDFLDRYGVYYESQKIFYIYAEDDWIIRYYIADFFIPNRNIVIEVDGKKYHEHHKQHDRDRDRTIQEHYPEVEILRYTWQDLSDNEKMMDLLWRIS